MIIIVTAIVNLEFLLSSPYNTESCKIPRAFVYVTVHDPVTRDVNRSQAYPVLYNPAVPTVIYSPQLFIYKIVNIVITNTYSARNRRGSLFIRTKKAASMAQRGAWWD